MARHPLAQATLDKLASHPDEPIFILRAQDITADTAVEKWADVMQSLVGADHPKVVAARDIAAAMRAHPSRKVPD